MWVGTEREDKKILIIILRILRYLFIFFFCKQKGQLLFYAIPRTDKGNGYYNFCKLTGGQVSSS